MRTLNDIQDAMHIGAAILHVDRYYQEELKYGKLPNPLYNVLLSHDLVNMDGTITKLGNEVFSSTDLIRYWHLIQPELCSTSPRKMHYDMLRSGLAQHTKTRAIDYLDYIHSLGFVPNSVCDLGGGDGMYLRIICEHFGSNATLIDNRVDPDTMDLPGDYRVEVLDFKDPKWNWPWKYQMVLLNEVLHLDTKYKNICDTILVAHRLLTPGGYLVIGENSCGNALNWRLNLLTGGYVLPIDELMFIINEEFKSEFEEEAKILTLDSHYYVALRSKSNG